MGTARSAARTCGLERSASEYTATASSPSSWQARTMRSAISPRLAIRTRFTDEAERRGITGPQASSAGGRPSGGVAEEEEQAAAEEGVVAGRAVVDAADVLHPG